MSDQFLLRADGSGEPHRRTTDCDGRCLPVVVISPEDREQVERLMLSYYKGGQQVIPAFVDRMQAALREFANPTPPKPDEPLGLGAVVEDDEGHKWMRHGDGPAAWMLAGAAPGNRETYPYAEISAVRILSEGVTP